MSLSLFLEEFNKHKKNTKKSFNNVKRDNFLIAKKLRDHENE